MMKQVVNCADPLIRLIKDHKDVSEYLDAFGEILDLLCDENAWSNIRPIEYFFKRKVIDHFKFEEEIIFPAILSSCAKKETIKLILDLQKEHGFLLKSLEEFRNIYKGVIPLDKELRKIRLNVMGREIMEGILSHASKEDDKLLPILGVRGNKRV